MRPSSWSFLRKRRPVQKPEPEPVAAAPPPDVPDDDMLRRVSDTAWRVLVIGVVVVLLLWGILYIRVVALPVILAIFLTALLLPSASWLRGKGLSRGLATTIVMVGALVVFGGLITMIVSPAVSGFNGLVESVTEAIVLLQGYATSIGLDQALVNQFIEQAQSELQADSGRVVSGAWAGAVAAGEILVGLILVLVLTVYFVHSGDRLMQWVRELFPQPTRYAVKFAGDVAYDVMGRYVRGIALVGLFDAVFIGLVLVFVLDPALALPLILLTFIGAFLPVIGAFLSGVLSALVAFVAEDWKVALIVIVATIVVQQLESHLFAPRVYGKALDLPSAVVLLAIAIGSIVGGIAGAFLATPVAAVLAALLRQRPFAAAESVVSQAPPPAIAPDPAPVPARAGATPGAPPAAVAADTGAPKERQDDAGAARPKGNGAARSGPAKNGDE
ncbi:putative PurR-regulated permease PerM [Murinocardiopsis flavida]|uniref:Putative PurR-regulated permease PerM n=1 Tax=Murinocardiopsis flavida TaxID=645275 RepID=A0A2P8DLQ1_9ACTN|nr:putative PurR-regulated permease PerM [Murinocardiopsis flavida]